MIVIKRGTARRLGLHTPYNAALFPIPWVPGLTSRRRFEEFTSRFGDSQRIQNRFIYPSPSVYVERVPRRLR